MQKVDVIAKVFVLWGDKVLLIRRSQTDPHRPGEWDIPGGGVDVEQAEEVLGGCLREASEEAGLVLKPDQLTEVTGIDDLQEPGRVRHVYIAELAGSDEPGIVLSHEHDAYVWQPVDKMGELFNHRFYGAAFTRYLARG